MALISFEDARKLCGYQSRSQLYSLKNAQKLDPYLRPGGKGGADQLETDPPGHPPLVQYVHLIKADKHSKQPVEPPAVVETGGKGLDRKQLQQMVAHLSDEQLMDGVRSRRRRDHFAAIREEWVAELARLDAMERNGELVSKAQEKAEAFNCARAVRDALLGLADRLAPMLAATTDARECHRLLTEEHRVALRVLSDDLADG